MARSLPKNTAKVPTNTTKATGIQEIILAENAMVRDRPAVPLPKSAKCTPIVRPDMNARMAEMHAKNAGLAVIWVPAMATATALWELGQQGTAAAPATYARAVLPRSTTLGKTFMNVLNNLNSIGGEIRRCFFWAFS